MKDIKVAYGLRKGFEGGMGMPDSETAMARRQRKSLQLGMNPKTKKGDEFMNPGHEDSLEEIKRLRSGVYTPYNRDREGHLAYERYLGLTNQCQTHATKQEKARRVSIRAYRDELPWPTGLGFQTNKVEATVTPVTPTNRHDTEGKEPTYRTMFQS